MDALREIGGRVQKYDQEVAESWRRVEQEELEAEDKERGEAYNLLKASEQIYSVIGTLETSAEGVYGVRLVPEALASALAEIENKGDKEIVQVIPFPGGASGIQRLAGAVVIAKKKS